MLENNLVTASNILIKASYSLDLVEKRLLIALISTIKNNIYKTKEGDYIDKRKSITTEDLFTLDIIDYAERYNISLRTAKDEIIQAKKTLFERVVYYTNNENHTVKTRWISTEIEFDKDTNKIGIYWAKGIIPLVTELNSNFTSYNIKFISTLQSVYSLRLYEIFIMELNKNRKNKIDIVLKVEDIRSMLDLGSKYKLFTDFIKRVIDEPLLKINKDKYCNLKVSYLDAEGKPRFDRKGSRKVQEITFKVERITPISDVENEQIRKYGQVLDKG